MGIYENRELSWLRFNERVLEEAQAPENPLGEQLSFLSIFQSNLDEFFMVRVGSIYDQMLLSDTWRDSKTGMTCEEQLAAVFARCRELHIRKDSIYRNRMECLKKEQIEFLMYSQLTGEEKTYVHKLFQKEILPLISPQIVGKKQPFPFMRNKEIYAVVVLEKKGSEKLGMVSCSNGPLPRLIALPNAHRFMLLEELILHFVPDIFSHYKIRSKSLIRIIRSADIEPDESLDDEEDFRNLMERLVRRRNRLGAVKLEYSRLMDSTVLKTLSNYLNIKEDQLFYSESPLSLDFLSEIRDLLHNKRELFFHRRSPQFPAQIRENVSMISQIEEKDRLLSYPFESMEPFLNLLREAARDPQVVSIKITLYRMASSSEVIKALIQAAEKGKEVVAVVELRARFDEENNIEWSRRLEDAGCRLIYGLDHMKVHSKLCLITRCKDNSISYITQVGTGNYNEKTSRLYTDLSYMTARPEIAKDAQQVFQALCLGQTVEHMEHLLVAPRCLQNRILEKIDQEMMKAQKGEAAYIGIKINSLEDKVIIDKLVDASKAGVRIDLIVRGICCLISGIPEETENITIRSIVGRYLEHSRIYIFGEEVYLASADFMKRNTMRRVEVAIPVLDDEIRQRVRSMFDTMLRDNVKARIQTPDGSYVHIQGTPKINSQEIFGDQAREIWQNTDLS